VALDGLVHVVSIVPPTPISQSSQPQPIKLHFNIANVTGTGSSTQNTYIGTGAMTFDFIPTETCAPTEPCHPPPVQFSLESTVGRAAKPLIVNFTLTFDATGHLLQDGSSASLPQCTVDNPSLYGGGG
jgi:hypothetical protein